MRFNQKSLKHLLLIIVICACSVFVYAFEKSQAPAEEITQIELLSPENSAFIGKEVLSSGVTVFSATEREQQMDELEKESLVASVQIPENSCFHAVANESCVPGSPVQEIALLGDKTPAVIIPNGAMGIFSKGDAAGWACDSGDTITWKFEKYPMENKNSQTLGVGYIQDGVMHEMQTFRDSLSGEYELPVLEEGVYYIYVIALSSDPISLKEGEIEVN